MFFVVFLFFNFCLISIEFDWTKTSLASATSILLLKIIECGSHKWKCDDIIFIKILLTWWSFAYLEISLIWKTKRCQIQKLLISALAIIKGLTLSIHRLKHQFCKQRSFIIMWWFIRTDLIRIYTIQLLLFSFIFQCRGSQDTKP